jgi:hypothetical protein
MIIQKYSRQNVGEDNKKPLYIEYGDSSAILSQRSKWKDKNKTRIKIKSCITNCVLLQLCSSFRHRKVSFMT